MGKYNPLPFCLPRMRPFVYTFVVGCSVVLQLWPIKDNQE